MREPDWKGKSLDLIREASRHGEAKLDAQVQIATSADQRATVLAGIYAATATGIMVAIATGTVFQHPGPYLAGALAGMTSFLVGAYLCVLATLPTKFWTPGNDPHEWYEDIEAGKAIEIAMGQQAAHFDNAIRENNDALDRNARYFKWGAAIGIAAPIVAILAAGVTCLLVVAAAAAAVAA